MPYLRETVESVLAQTLTRFELVIGDDGSSDGSRNYLESLRDPRVRFFPSKARAGLFPHLNRLLLRCRSPLLRFLCQDDVLEANCLERETAFFAAHPDVAMTIAKYRSIGNDGRVLSEGTLRDLPDELPPSLAVQHFFYHGCIAGNLSTVAVRAEALQKRGFFDESYRVSGDYELWARLAPHAPLGMIHEHLVRVRSHERQLSRARQSSVPFVVENARIRRTLLPQLPASVKAAARRFERRRHHVLDFHTALRCALSGRWRAAARIARELGPLGSLRASLHWGLTLNNRRRPQAPWLLPDPY